jgi:hypothetical protein
MGDEYDTNVNCHLLHYEALKRSSAWMGYCTVPGCTLTHTTVLHFLKVYTLEKQDATAGLRPAPYNPTTGGVPRPALRRSASFHSLPLL